MNDMKQNFLFSILTFTCLIGSITSFSQNVGVGTTNPLQKLHVEGNSYIKDSLGLRIVKPVALLDVNGTALLRGNNTNTFTDSLRAAVEFFAGRGGFNAKPSGLSTADIALNWGGNGGGYRHFMASRHDVVPSISRNGIDFYINTSSTPLESAAPGIGNVAALSITDVGIGLGKPDPMCKIDIRGSGFKNRITFLDTATQDQLYLGTSAISFIGTPNQSKFGITTNNTYRLIVSETGNIGVGNMNPFAPLQFSNALMNRKMVLWQALNNDHRYLGFGVNPSILRYQVGDIWDSHVFFAATSDSTSQELMRISGTGDVGIGTDNPLQKLHVQGNAAVTGNLGIGTTASSVEKLYVNGNAKVENNFSVAGSVNLLSNLAIGTAAVPAERLYVSGDATVETNLTVNGQINMGYSSNFSDVAVNGSGFISSLTIGCPAGQKLLTGGGGHRDVDGNAQYIVINYNGPDANNPTTMWRLIVTNTGPLPRFIRIYCTCAKIN